tara:strand:- start:1013 stop:1240 length:228 start_codon:yes stop_codon:yes gene_type:complete
MTTVDNKNTKIFHGIIKDLSNMVEMLKIENDNMNDLVVENQKLKNKIEKYHKENYYKNLSLYFLITGLSIFLFKP